MINLDKLSIQIDTYCATGCTYCYLKDNKIKKLKFTKNDLDNLFKYFTFKEVNFFGGDILHDNNEVYKLIPILNNYSSIKSYSMPIELKHILDEKVEIERLISTVNKPIYFNISLHKSICCDKLTDVLYTLKELENMNFNYSFIKIIDREMITNPNLLDNIVNISKKTDKNIVLKTDYNFILQDSIDTTAFIKKLLEVVKNNKNIYFNQGSSKCILTEGKIIGVDNNGYIYDCIAVNPDNGLKENSFNIKNLTKVEANKIYSIIKNYKNFTEINKNCIDCVAKNKCSVCFKTAIEKSFNESNLHCSLYKQLANKDFTKNIKEKKKKRNVYGFFKYIEDIITNSIIYIDKEGQKNRKLQCKMCNHNLYGFCNKDFRIIKTKAYKDKCPLNKWEIK